MQLFRTVGSVAIAALAVNAPIVSAFNVTIGTRWTDGKLANIAWETNRACQTVTEISRDPQSPCGHSFSAGGVGGLMLKGCNTPRRYLTRDGRWFTGCRAVGEVRVRCRDGREFTVKYRCY
jgi:hypothetical protein